MAMNTHRQLGIGSNRAANSMERLASGLRINRAGDDAAGLAISEKMRGQIRGLRQASRNGQDGISTVQTAEGALKETHEILQRMRELAVQSSNDTNMELERESIQGEIDELAAEVSRISANTEFNTQNLLDGTFDGRFHIGGNAGQNINLVINDMSAEALGVSGDGTGDATFELTDAHDLEHSVGELGIVQGTNELDVVEINNITVGNAVANYGLANEDGDIVAISQDGKTYKFLDDAYAVGDLAAEGTVQDDSTDLVFGETVKSGTVTFEATAGGDLTEITASAASVETEGLATGTYTNVEIGNTSSFDDYFGDGKIETGDNWDKDKINAVLVDDDDNVVAVRIDGHANAAEGEFYSIDDVDFSESWGDSKADILSADATAIMTTVSLSDGDTLEVKAEGGIDISSQDAASRAIETIDTAIQNVSRERSMLGATQNRLDHTIKNLDTSVENLQAAESRIRDIDMAQEMMEFTKSNILQQAGQAMLAQANQAPQGVLQLLG